MLKVWREKGLRKGSTTSEQHYRMLTEWWQKEKRKSWLAPFLKRKKNKSADSSPKRTSLVKPVGYLYMQDFLAAVGSVYLKKERRLTETRPNGSIKPACGGCKNGEMKLSYGFMLLHVGKASTYKKMSSVRNLNSFHLHILCYIIIYCRQIIRFCCCCSLFIFFVVKNIIIKSN